VDVTGPKMMSLSGASLCTLAPGGPWPFPHPAAVVAGTSSPFPADDVWSMVNLAAVYFDCCASGARITTCTRNGPGSRTQDPDPLFPRQPFSAPFGCVAIFLPSSRNSPITESRMVTQVERQRDGAARLASCGVMSRSHISQ